ncbi:MAG: Gfo/Idh/MocA family protein [Halobacteriaceae archaeon]
MSEDIRYGVVGCAGIAPLHGAAVQQTDGATLVGAADIVAENAEEFAAEWGGTAYTDTTEMIESEDVDAVSVCTPSGTHAEVAVEAIEAGAHVLCEKPLDVYLDRIDAMIERADEHDKQLASVFQRRTFREHQRAKRAIEDGDLGDLVMGDTVAKFWRDQDYYDSADWRGTRAMDGGALMNQAIHFVDLLQWLMGGVESVYAYTDTLTWDMEMEDVAAVALTFENGAVGTMEASTTVRGSGTGVEINGTSGTYDHGEFRLEEGDIEAPEDDHSWGDGHVRVVEDFVTALREGTEPMVPAREGRKAVEVILAAYASANLGREVRIDELDMLREHT